MAKALFLVLKKALFLELLAVQNLTHSIVVDILLQESDTREVQISKYIQYIKININIRVDNESVS